MSKVSPAQLAAVPTTQTSTLYDRLREDLLSGRLKPGRKLQMRFLMDTYQAGQTPLREALNRLTTEGLVEPKEQRGFYVTPISRSELEELTKTRCWVEGLALRQAMSGPPSSGWASISKTLSRFCSAPVITKLQASNEDHRDRNDKA